MFYNAEFTEITIANSVREPFYNCLIDNDGLERVTFSTPLSLERIHADINDTSIAALSIPGSMRHVGGKRLFN